MTRFAPAPTGLLHLGHVVNAIFVWGMARARGSRVLLRVEDHDAQRCRPEFERALIEDLDWLGFEPDVFPTDAFRAGRCEGRQSDRGDIYAEAARNLIARGFVYGCRCTRQDLAQHAGAGASEVPYLGTCRSRGLTPAEGMSWRVRIEPGAEAFHDALAGPQIQEPAQQCGDVVIRDRLGNWTYQFAAAVDDMRQRISLVVRGHDLLASTGRQMRLARLMGRTTPATFAHHPLVMKSATQKLSKSDGDTGVRALRAGGWTPERVIGDAASRVGLCPADTSVPARAVADFFLATLTSPSGPLDAL